MRSDAVANREALLAAARVALNRDPDASLEAIATLAGLSRRSLYGHFATRDELLRELISTGAARVAAGVAAVDHSDPLVRLALIAARLWHEVENIRVMALFAVRGPLKGLTAAALAPLRARVAAAVAEGVAAGSVRSDIPAATLARLIEDAALSALEEASTGGLASEVAHRLVILLVLSTAGLSAADSARLIDAHPELAA